MRVGNFETNGVTDSMRVAFGLARYLAWPSVWLPSLSSADRHLAERRWALGLTSLLEVDLFIGGLEHISPDTSYVVAPLHEGLFDPALLLHLPLDLMWVARDEMAEWRYLGRYLRRTGQIVITDESTLADLRDLHRRARAFVDRGESVVVFPQGSILGIEVAFSRGAFWLADALEIPLLPVAIAGTHRIWEHPYSRRIRFGEPAALRVLEPLEIGTAIDQQTHVERAVKATALELPAPVRRFDPERDGYWDGYRYEIDPVFPELAADVAAHRLNSMVT